MSADGGLSALLSDDDLALVEAATVAVRGRYRYGRHTVGAALRGASGRVYAAVNLDATVGRAAVCAEAVALGASVMAGDAVVSAVAVRQATQAEGSGVSVVPPCGLCRELLLDHAPDAEVIMPGRGRVAIASLLPGPYRR